MTTVADVLGSKLYRRLHDYDYHTGVWKCTLGSGNAIQADIGIIPRGSFNPGGQSCPEFNGRNMALQIAALTTLPTYSSTQNFLMGFLARVDGIGSVFPLDNGYIWQCNDINNTIYITSSGTLSLAATGDDLFSNSSIVGAGWKRVIFRKNGSNPSVLTINGVDQTDTGDGSFGSTWKTDSSYIGLRNDASSPLSGAIAEMFWAFDASVAFDSTIVANLDSALQDTLNDPGTSSSVSSSSVSVNTSSLFYNTNYFDNDLIFGLDPIISSSPTNNTDPIGMFGFFGI